MLFPLLTVVAITITVIVAVLATLATNRARALYGAKSTGSVGAVMLLGAYLAENAGYEAVG